MIFPVVTFIFQLYNTHYYWFFKKLYLFLPFTNHCIFQRYRARQRKTASQEQTNNCC